MKVIVSVGGRFHAFNLAQQLEKRGFLQKLITSYPKFETVKYGIPKNKIKSILIKEVIDRGWRKAPVFLKNLWNPQYLMHEIFDRLASRGVKEGDLFVGLSSFASYSFLEAKKRGMVTVVDRGSSHMLYQQKILKEEYEAHGLKAQLAHPKIVEKELTEYREADYIAIPSLFVKRTFLANGVSEKKLIHVPYGVELKDFYQIPKTDDTFRVVFVGGMTLRKGVHYLLKAFSELNLPNSELLLVGSLTDEIKPFFKKYEGSFNWIGPKPQKELYKYYSQGSVFAMMSIEEGLAMVQAQAMACGLPMICTTNTGGEDLIREGVDGFVIPIRDTESLKKKLVFLYENPDIRKQMGESAKVRVSSGFTWDDYGDKMIKAYEKILAAKIK